MYISRTMTPQFPGHARTHLAPYLDLHPCMLRARTASSQREAYLHMQQHGGARAQLTRAAAHRRPASPVYEACSLRLLPWIPRRCWPGRCIWSSSSGRSTCGDDGAQLHWDRVESGKKTRRFLEYS
jgi:hypothetical protein